MEISPGNFTREGRPPPKAEGPAGHKVEVLRGERPAEGLEAARASVLSSKLRGTMRTATILRTKASTGKCSATTTAKRGMVGSSATGSSGWAGRRGAPLRSDFAARGVAVGKDGFPLEEDFPRKRRQVAPLLYVRQVMTQASDVTCLSSDGSLRDALELFLEKRVSGAPVIDGKGKLVGVLSMTDIIWVETTEAMDALPFQSEHADTGVSPPRPRSLLSRF